MWKNKNKLGIAGKNISQGHLGTSFPVNNYCVWPNSPLGSKMDCVKYCPPDELEKLDEFNKMLVSIGRW